MNMKKLKKDQRGITLIELVIAIALTGVITAAITMSIFQVFNMNTRTSNHMAAVSHVQQAGKLVREDIMKAQNVDTGDDPGTPELELLTLTWKEGGTEIPHEVIYTLEDMSSGEFKILWRYYYINPDINPDPVSTTKVAEYIDPDQTSCCCDCDGDGDGDCDGDCNCDDAVVIFRVTANVGGQSETRVYEVMPRAG
ncbi:MAG: prepilin-type N-terminal cleavage/methylation domain-containing protein [Dehalococcoidia bacterium]|nr:prepilin-type N-terminal cleavage/methylation domain-containing protein [Dehalococcoidia bacterium]